MNTFLRYIRYIVFLSTVFIIAAVYLYFSTTIPASTLQVIRLTQTYAFLAVSYLYLALITSPLIAVFPNFFANKYLMRARRAVGVSAFLYALTHACFAFFGQLGGFEGLGFLSNSYLIAITLSFTALVILTLMAATSFDTIIAKMSFGYWKLLHRFVYLAGAFIIIHALMLGTHFSESTGFVYQICFVAIAILLIFESIRFDTYLEKRFEFSPRFGFTFVCIVGLLITAFFSQLSGNSSLNVHSQHMQMAKNETTTQQNNQMAMTMPGMQGDPSKRYTVSFQHDNNIQVNRDTRLNFKVYDANNGDQVFIFSKLYDKLLHLVVVDDELKFFDHIHPQYNENGFYITTKFPHSGVYRLYLDFQPLGAIEQQFAFSVLVGNGGSQAKPTYEADKSYSKIYGNYKVDFAVNGPFDSDLVNQGKQKMVFTLYNAKTQVPITTLKPYLASFGHMVLINVDTYEYIHVHPSTLTPPAPNENGGPTVEFIPLGLYSTIKPGTYRVFAQFNPDNNLFTADYTIVIK